MSEVYKVGVGLALTSNHMGVLGALSQQLLHVHGQIGKIEQGWDRVRKVMAIGGGLAVAGGLQVLKGVEHIEKAGEKLYHARTVFEAGLSKQLSAQERSAVLAKVSAAAWAEAGRNMNSTASGNVAALTDLNNILQDVDHSIKLLPAFNKIQNTSLSVAGAHGQSTAGSEKNTRDAILAFELMGRTSTEALEKMAEGFTKATIAMAGRVKGSNFLTQVQNSGGARAGWSDDFASTGLPALMGAMGGRTGNAMYNIHRNLLSGVASSETQAHLQEKWGLHSQGDEIRERGKFKGFKQGSVWGAEMLRQDPIAWANAFRDFLKNTKGVNVDDQATMLKIATEIGRGNKYLETAMDELIAPQYNKQINKEREKIRNTADTSADLLNSKDPVQIRAAFAAQWHNFLEALGDPLVQPAMDALKQATFVLRDLTKVAVEHPDAVKMLGIGIAGLGAALVGAGGLAILAAIGVGGWLIGGIAAAGSAFAMFHTPFENWLKDITGMGPAMDKADKWFNDLALSFGKMLTGGQTLNTVLDTVAGAIVKLGNALGDFLKKIIGAIGGGGGLLNGGNGGGVTMPDELYHPSSFHVGGAGGSGGGGGGNVLVPGGVSMTAAERNTMGLIQLHESHGRNVMNYIGDRTHTAQGYYQLTNTNWRRIAPKLGITAPNASSASREDQTRVALELLRHGGVQNWSNFNPSLRGALRRGDRAPVGPAEPAPTVPAYRASKPVMVQANLHLDGKQIATHVTKHQFRDGNGPSRGSNFSDQSLNYPQVA